MARNGEVSIGERVNIDFSSSDFEANTEDAIVLTEKYEKLLDVKKADGSDLFDFFRKVKMCTSEEIKEIREDRVIKFKEIK